MTVAAASLALQLLIVVYTDVRDVLHDEQGLNGFIWWAGALWIFPIIGVLTLLTSLLRNCFRGPDVGK